MQLNIGKSFTILVADALNVCYFIGPGIKDAEWRVYGQFELKDLPNLFVQSGAAKSSFKLESEQYCKFIQQEMGQLITDQADLQKLVKESSPEKPDLSA